MGEKGWEGLSVLKEAGDLRSPEGGCGLATGKKASWALGRRRTTGGKMNKLRGGEREVRLRFCHPQASWAYEIIRHTSSRGDWRHGRFETMV